MYHLPIEYTFPNSPKIMKYTYRSQTPHLQFKDKKEMHVFLNLSMVYLFDYFSFFRPFLLHAHSLKDPLKSDAYVITCWPQA